MKKKESRRKMTYAKLTMICAIIGTFIAGVAVMNPAVTYKACFTVNNFVDQKYELISAEYNVYVESDLNLSDDEKALVKESVEQRIARLPLYQNNYMILITNDNIEDDFGEASKEGVVKCGYAVDAWKLIKINALYFNAAFTHEIGHAIDFNNNFSTTDEFTALYNKVSHDNYFTSNHYEYFADGYDRFVNKRMNKDAEYELITYFEGILGVKY